MYQGIRLLLWFQGTPFFSFLVRAFCMRLLNAIHDEIGNRSFACWICLDFSLEIALQTNRSKAMYKGNRRKEFSRWFGRQKTYQYEYTTNHLEGRQSIPLCASVENFEFSCIFFPRTRNTENVERRNCSNNLSVADLALMYGSECGLLGLHFLPGIVRLFVPFFFEENE